MNNRRSIYQNLFRNSLESSVDTISRKKALHNSMPRPIGAEELRELIRALGHDPFLIAMVDLREIAARLSEMVGKHPAWGESYLHNVIRERQAPSAKLARAIMALGAAVDGAPVDLAKAASIHVFALANVRPGSLILADSRRCAYPSCGLWFVPVSWNQRCHSKDCARELRRLRRRQ